MNDEASKQESDSDRKKKPLYRNILTIAEAYLAIGQIVGNVGYATKQGTLGIPAVVNTAFSVELLLKFWLAVQHPDDTYAQLVARGVKLRGKGHSCVELWDKMPRKFQLAITADYAMVVKAKQEPPDIRAVLFSLGDDPFFTWRYPYEFTSRKNINFSELERLATTMHSLAKRASARLDKGERENFV